MTLRGGEKPQIRTEGKYHTFGMSEESINGAKPGTQTVRVRRRLKKKDQKRRGKGRSRSDKKERLPPWRRAVVNLGGKSHSREARQGPDMVGGGGTGHLFF